MGQQVELIITRIINGEQRVNNDKTVLRLVINEGYY